MPCHPSVVLLRPLLLRYLQRVCPSNIPGKRSHAVMPAERRDERCGYMARRGHAEMCWCCAPLGQLAELLRQAHHFRRGCKHSPWFLEGAARAQVPFLSTVASAGASLKAEGAEHQGHLCSSPLPPAAENSMSRAMSRALLLIKHSLLALITHQGFRSARPAGWFGFAQRCPAVRLFLPAS